MTVSDATFAAMYPAQDGPDWDSWHALVEQINGNKAFFATLEGGGAGCLFIQIQVVETGMFLALGDNGEKWAVEVFTGQAEMEDSSNAIDSFELDVKGTNRNPFAITQALFQAWGEFNAPEDGPVPAVSSVDSIQFDYRHEAWVVNGRYQACGHKGTIHHCTCYGTIHEGEPVAADAELG